MIMKKICGVSVCLLLLAAVLSGCGSRAGTAAKQAMTAYLDNIGAAKYDVAYGLLSDFDKSNISEELFIRWQESVARIAKTESFTIDEKIDVFPDYEYLGTEFGTVYGLKVDRVQKVLIPEIELVDYDAATFRIMVQMKDDQYKVLLLLTDLDETVAAYEAYLEKLE